MKCITLWQPWATLLLSPYKRIETRRFALGFRGRLLIHAAKRFKGEESELCQREPFASCLLNAGYDSASLPLGAIIGSVLVVDCVRTEDVPWPEMRAAQAETEAAFGDFRSGRWAWVTEDPQTFREPVPYAGRQSFFDVELPPHVAAIEEGWRQTES